MRHSHLHSLRFTFDDRRGSLNMRWHRICTDLLHVCPYSAERGARNHDSDVQAVARLLSGEAFSDVPAPEWDRVTQKENSGQRL